VLIIRKVRVFFEGEKDQKDQKDQKGEKGEKEKEITEVYDLPKAGAP
jgi:hypothetical protein